jgi:hypothetical protein
MANACVRRLIKLHALHRKVCFGTTACALALPARRWKTASARAGILQIKIYARIITAVGILIAAHVPALIQTKLWQAMAIAIVKMPAA